MKHLSLFLALMMSVGLINAQSIHQCGTDELHQKLMENDISYRKKVEKDLKKVYDKLHSNIDEVRTSTLYTIPVVVHVMHLGEEIGNGSNISLAQIEAGIQDLNEAFRNIGHYAGDPQYTNANIPSQDIEIEFCLAVRDPEGNPTNGVNRVETSYSNLIRDLGCDGQNQDGCLKALSFWNSYDYVNIWLVNEICTSNASQCGTAGYAYLPSAHGRSFDGIVNEARYFGTSKDNSKVHIHEMGHYLGLYHTFSSECETDCETGGDLVCDTPPDISNTAVNCNNGGTANTCTNDANITNSPFTTDVEDMYENYMDYGYSNCQNTFTQGQKDRMRATLTNIRQSLLSSQACVIVPVAPVANLYAETKEVCTGVSVQYIDNSVGEVISRAWSFPGGTPSTSTEKNPVVVYNSEGNQSATLTVSNSHGSNTYTVNDYISVLGISRGSAPSATNQSTSVNYSLGIKNVTLEGINNTTLNTSASGIAYEDFACSYLTELQVGQEYTISITAGRSGFKENVRAWIDYDKNGIIDEVNELVFSADNVDGTPVSQTFLVPVNAFIGERLLLRVSSDVYFRSVSSTGTDYGQIEDYGVLISPESPLPLDWLSFDARALDQSIELLWRTENEVDNAIFEVERMTQNGRFEMIGTVQPNNLMTENRYTFVDENVVANQRYFYRIKQVDLDGAFTYSEVRSASTKSSKGDFSVYPNPSKGIFTISGLDSEQVSNLSVYNALGQKIAVTVIENLTDYSFNLGNKYINGIYWVAVEMNDGTTQVQRLIKY